MVIGLTGKYCSGKSYATLALEKKDFLQIDVDKLGHSALEEKKSEIEKAFGNSVITNGVVNRKLLGKIVFKNKSQRALLESIVHPVMVDNVKTILQLNKGKNIVINAAILADMGLDKFCDAVIWVDAPLFARIRRAISRDKAPLFSIIKRIIAQANLKSNLTKKNADTYIIENKGNIKDFSESVEKTLKLIETGK